MFLIGNSSSIIVALVLMLITTIILVALSIAAYISKVLKEKEIVEKKPQVQNTRQSNGSLQRLAKEKKDISSRKRSENYTVNNTANNTQVGDSIMEEKLRKKEAELNVREEMLNDREMAIAASLDELIELKKKVDQIIKDQESELFGYCSVSEESALKMKEVTLEVKKRLDETIRKIQE